MTKTSSAWVEEKLAAMSLDQKIGQLMHPYIHPQKSEEEILEHLAGREPGGLFVFHGSSEEVKRTIATVQNLSPVPVVISADLENGAGRIIKDATVFPEMMSVAATDDVGLAYQMGRAAAIEGRECGIHWTFGPVVDINANWRNPITNTRGLGDDPNRISRLSVEMIKGMQENGLCATAKHFPGDGYDERDQHVCTTINPLTMDFWRQLSGRMFADAIDLADVWSIMIGHIALPAWDPGKPAAPDSPQTLADAPPATLSRALTTDLLRGELGFDGLIITDALTMGGITSWGTREDIIVGALEAGCDQLLFSMMGDDFDHVRRAVDSGRLSEEHIDASVRRVLALKEKLQIQEKEAAAPCEVSDEDRESFQNVATEIAERAVRIEVDRFNALPLDISDGKKILSIHYRAQEIFNIDGIDALLCARGADVDVYNEQSDDELPSIAEIAADYDIILVHYAYGPSWCTNMIRPNGLFLRTIVDRVPIHDPRTVFISYGSPYLLKDMPRIPTLINAYSTDANTQRAVVKLLTGELQPTGTSPVELD